MLLFFTLIKGKSLTAQVVNCLVFKETNGFL